MLLLNTSVYVPGGPGHVGGDSGDGVGQEAVRVTGGHLLSLVDGARVDAINKSVESGRVHLEASGVGIIEMRGR